MKLRVGVVGLGFMGSAHARVYSQLKECELVAICDSDSGKKQLAKGYRCKFFEDSRDFLEEKMDAVSVCTPTSMHRDLVINALEKGKHVLVEKPLADNLRSGEEMMKKASKLDRLLTVGYIERFNPAVSKLKEIVDFGKIFSTISFRFGPYPPRIKDSGVLLDVASHEIDLLSYLTGTKPEIIYVNTSNHLNNGFEDYAYLSLKFSHIHSHIEVSWLPNYKLRFMNIYGNESFYLLNYAQQNIKCYKAPPRANINSGSWQDILWMSRNVNEDIPVLQIEPLKLELKCFIESVEKEKIAAPLCSCKEGLNVLKIAEEALEYKA